MNILQNPLNIMFSRIAAAAGLLVTANTAHAELLISESFNENSAGWAITQNSGTSVITETTLSYQNLNTQGGSLEVRPSNPNLSHLYTKQLQKPVTSGTVWLSFLMKPERTGQGHCFFGLGSFIGVGKNWGTTFSIDNKISGKPVIAGETYRILARFDIKAGPDEIRLWVNPPLDFEPLSTSALLYENAVEIATIDRLQINCRAANNNPVYVFDEIRLGTRWADVNDVRHGDFEAAASVTDKEVGGPYYAKFKFPVPVTKLTANHFRISNGRIMSISGKGKVHSVLIKPLRKGTVKLTLGKGLAKSPFGEKNSKSTSISVNYDPAIETKPVSESMAVDDYVYTLAGTSQAHIWKGKHTMLVLDLKSGVDGRDQVLMSQIVDIMDRAFADLKEHTGYQPTSGSTLLPIEIAKDLKEAKALVGKMGIAIPTSEFETLYRSKAKTIPPVFFQKLALNFWKKDHDLHLDYFTSPGQQNGWWRIAFSRLLALTTARQIKVELSPSNNKIESALIREMDIYLRDKKYSWYKTFGSPALPWARDKSVDHVMAGLILHLAEKHGGPDFIYKFLKNLPNAKVLKSRRDKVTARDNIFLTSSRASGKDLSTYFTKTLKWPVTSKARKQIKE